MKIKTLYMFPQDKEAYLTAYIRDTSPEMKNDPRPAVLICPGGAYHWVSDRENEPVALQFLARGYNVFVLKYSVAEKSIIDTSFVGSLCFSSKTSPDSC